MINIPFLVDQLRPCYPKKFDQGLRLTFGFYDRRGSFYRLILMEKVNLHGEQNFLSQTRLQLQRNLYFER